MMRKLLPLLLALAGLAGGAGAGLLLRPDSNPSPVADETPSDTEEGADANLAAGSDPESLPDYVKLSNQFIIPVVTQDRVAAMVVLSLSLEVAPGTTEAVFEREPKLRDAFLQVLFDHANLGGFSGSFTDGSNLVLLRSTLLDTARMVMGPVVLDVLITDIARQDN